MRIDPLLAAYLTSTFILAITPGATTAVVVRSTLARGWRGGLAAAAGAACGNTTQAIVAAFGVAVLFAQWPMAATVLRVCGAAFLLWLGMRSLRRAGRRSSRMNIPGSTPHREYSSGMNVAFREGLTVNLLNPAITSFYVVVLPAFIPPNAPPWYYAFLAAAHVVLAFICHSAWTFAFGRLRQVTAKPAVARALELATAVVLIALAAKVLAD